jgi:iterative type I PKS product template protein
MVHIAFNIGQEATRRSECIDSSGKSWATLVRNIDVERAQRAIDSFNDTYILEGGSRLYISAETSSSVTVSGPPHIASEALDKMAIFQKYTTTTLPISAAFHAKHLRRVPWPRIIDGVGWDTLKRSVQDYILLSPSSGIPYGEPTLEGALTIAVDDIFQNLIRLEMIIDGLTKVLDPSAVLVQFGPCHIADKIKQSLQTRGVNLNDLEKTPLVMSSTCEQDRSVAIVGMSVRLPGSETLEEFWKVLEDGRDLHEKIRSDRFDLDTHFDPTGKTRNTTLTPYGVFIDRPGYFDIRMFNMSPREAAQTDPQQRLMLLTTYEALEMAGYQPNTTPSTNTRRIGSWIGQTSDDYREVNASQNIDTYFITGGIRAFGPGRLNYHFGWEGPSYSVDTACSSSAASIQLAYSALLAHECDMAVAGGANCLTSPDLFAGLSRANFLSKTGGCKTFDPAADGYVRADGIGIVVMKRLEDAIRDRDNIQAVIKSAVTNHSAEALSITHPHAATQARLFNAAFRQAGCLPSMIDYAELHGTGTQAGDLVELTSIKDVLSLGPKQNCLLAGTVKPNLGHGEAASGVTSLIKAIMILKKNKIPPHIGIKGQRNRNIPQLADTNIRLSFGMTNFVAENSGDGKRRILINNFNAAGGNTSMVIEDPPTIHRYGDDVREHHIVTVTGKTSYSILENSKRLLSYLTRNPEVRIEDVAYTTTARRMHHVVRQAHSVTSISELCKSLKIAVSAPRLAKRSVKPHVIFLFTGQGSQYSGMSLGLYNVHPVFRESLLEMEQICLFHGFESFLPLICKRDDQISEASPVQIQLAIVAVELGIAALWKSIGVVPTATIGHSLGEYPALYTAGVISLSDCLFLVGMRASLMVASCTSRTHSMLAVQASVGQVETLLHDLGAMACEVSCVNTENSTVIGGPVAEIFELRKTLQSDQQIKSVMLDVQFAFHTAQIDPILNSYRRVAAKAQFSAPCIPFASTLLGSCLSSKTSIDGEYLVRHARERVRFTEALSSLNDLLCSDSPRVWIETGPSPSCLSMVRSSLAGNQTLLPSLKVGASDHKTFVDAVVGLYNTGVEIDWREYHRPHELSLHLLELPNYAFDLKNYWLQYKGDWAITKGEAHSLSFVKARFSTTSLHRIDSETTDDNTFIVTFATDAWEPNINRVLRGHLVNGVGLCPSSVYGEMAFTAAKYIQSSSGSPTMSMDVKFMKVQKPLLIESEATAQVIVTTASKKNHSNIVDVRFSSRNGKDFFDHAHCIVQFGDEEEWKSDWACDARLIRARMTKLTDRSSSGLVHRLLRQSVYKRFRALVDYDEKYQGIQEVYLDSHLHEASASVKFHGADSDGPFTHNPYWIDSLAHLSGFVLNGSDTVSPDQVYISSGWESLKIIGELLAEKDYQSYVRMEEIDSKGIWVGDVYFFDGDQVVALCKCLKFQRIQRRVLNCLIPSPGSPEKNEEPVGFVEATHTTMSQKKLRSPKNKLHDVVSKDTLVDTSFPGNDKALEIVATRIGVSVSELGDDDLLSDLGVDSLLSIDIAEGLRDLLGKGIPAALFHGSTKIKDLRKYFGQDYNHKSISPTGSGENDHRRMSTTCLSESKLSIKEGYKGILPREHNKLKQS